MATGRVFTVLMEDIGVTVAKDLFRISAPADGIVLIHEVSLTQSSDAGDAESEQLPVQLQRSSTDGTGTSATPEKMQVGSGAFGGSAVTNLTVDTTQTAAALRKAAQNVMNGWHWLFTPETQIVVPPSGRFVVRLDAAPTDSLTMHGYVVIEEIG